MNYFQNTHFLLFKILSVSRSSSKNTIFGLITVSTMKHHINLLSDIDECATRKHNCSVDGVCGNVEGSYKCGCKPGYSGDGRTCKGTAIIFHMFNKELYGLLRSFCIGILFMRLI